MFQTKTETHHATCIILMLLASGFPEAMAVEGAIFCLGVGNGKVLYISIKIYSGNLTSFHQWDAKATKYLPNVLE